MKQIRLTKNKVALVDSRDHEDLSRFSWGAKLINGLWYAIRKEGEKTIFMHRQILRDCKSPQIDHKDHDGLNNQRHNLRPCTHSQNQMNSKLRKDNVSGIKGVHWYKKASKWKAQIKVSGKLIYLGVFTEKESAIRARKKAEKVFYGEFAG